MPEVSVRGKFVRNGKGPLGQSAARHAINVPMTTRSIDLTQEEFELLTRCGLCARATANPGFHFSKHNDPADRLRLPHCEVCDSFRSPDGRFLEGWYTFDGTGFELVT